MRLGALGSLVIAVAVACSPSTRTDGGSAAGADVAGTQLPSQPTAATTSPPHTDQALTATDLTPSPTLSEPAGPTEPAGGSGLGQAPPTPAQWGKPIVTDEFDGAAVDPAKWYVYDGPDAAQFPRSADRVGVADGLLHITGGYDELGRDVAGGMSSLLHQYYGRWEVRMRAEPGAGYSAVALLWPQSQRWPDDGEIDLAEAWDGSRTHVKTAVHNGPDNAIVKTEYQVDFTQWHVLAVDWLPSRITFWIDGAVIFTVSPGDGGYGINMIPSTSPMHMALQLDKGCDDEGIECRNGSTPSEVKMYVDWVRIYGLPG